MVMRIQGSLCLPASFRPSLLREMIVQHGSFNHGSLRATVKPQELGVEGGIKKPLSSQFSLLLDATPPDAAAIAHSTPRGLLCRCAELDSEPFNPPAIPLAVRTPYLQTWSRQGTVNGSLTSAWPTFSMGSSVSRLPGVLQ